MDQNGNSIMEIKQEIADSQYPSTSQPQRSIFETPSVHDDVKMDLDDDVKSEPDDLQMNGQWSQAGVEGQREATRVKYVHIYNVKQPQKVDRPVVHRCTGKIGIEYLRERRNIQQQNARANEMSTENVEPTSCELQAPALQNIAPAMPARVCVVHVPQQNPQDLFVIQNNHPNPSTGPNPIPEQAAHQSPDPVNLAAALAILNMTRVPCPVCNETFASRRTLQNHFKSQKHKKNLEQQQQANETQNNQ